MKKKNAKTVKKVKASKKSSKAKKAKKLTKSKVCCTKCGECKGVSKDRMAKLIGQFGSIEELHTNYVCRGCRKEHNLRADGKMKPEKRKRKKSVLPKDKNGNAVLPEWMRKPLPPRERRLCTDEELAQLNICFATSHWSKYKCCNNCHRYLKNACGCKSIVILKGKALEKHMKEVAAGEKKEKRRKK